MSSITKVALAGATGNLGPAILDALVTAGFQVTVLTRSSSSHTFPPGVHAVPVDYDSLPSLTTALHGHDAVISTLTATALSAQLQLIRAAAAAGVQRFLPSEFGSNTINAATAALPCFGDKIAVQDALKNEAAAHGGKGMSYTLVHTGPFFDWCIKVGLVMQPKSKSIVLYDGGERAFSTTTLADIGLAVVGVLNNLDETRNRAVYVQSAAPTLKQLLGVGKKVLGDEGWNVQEVEIKGLVEEAYAELEKEKPERGKSVINFIKAAVWGEEYGGHFRTLDNDLLGVKEMSEAQIEELVKSFA